MNNSKSYSKSIAEIFICEICDIGYPNPERWGLGLQGANSDAGVENGMLPWTELKEFLKYVNNCKPILKTEMIFCL